MVGPSVANHWTARRRDVPGTAWPGDGMVDTLGGEGEARRLRCFGVRAW